jgi:phage minor structural protein
MSIRVYDPAEKLFDHNGIKALHPLFAEVTKVDNGDYYVDLEDVLSNLEYYQKGMIVRVPTPWGVQGFRCDNPVIKNNRISCKAWHLSYDAKNYLIVDSNAVNKNCNDALNHFNDNTDIASPFAVSSDITALVSTRAVRRTLFEIFELFISTDRYGGHWDRDNFNFSIQANIGQDRGVVLAYNKNITDIEVSENWDNVCTKVLPYTTDGDVAIQLDETYVELAEKLYDIPYSKTVKFDNVYEKDNFASEAEFISVTKEWLKAQANAYLEANKVPLVNYSVSAKLENVSDVGDTIYVKHPKCNVNITTNVISVVYDAIKGKYSKIEFGNFKKELKNFSQTITEEVKKETETQITETKALLQGELAEATARINSVLGNSYVIDNGNEIIVVDRLPKEDAICCLKINSAGIGFSNTGINGTFNSAWTIDGTLNMQAINVINFTASLIKGGTLKLGGVNNSSGTFELYDASNRLMSLMDSTGLTVYATNGDYVKLNAEVGFAGYDKNNTKIYWADGDVFRMKNAEVENEIKIAGKIKVVPVSTSDNVGVGFVAII